VRFVGLASLLVAASLLSGCGAEAPRQAGARVAVEEFLATSRYDPDRTRCTDNPSAWFIERETEVFICAATRRAGGCDWYRATLKNAGWDVMLDRRNAGCVLPF
jgi:hypothetical protein